MSHGLHIPNEQPPKGKDENTSKSFLKWATGQIPFVVTQLLSLLLAVGTFIYYVFHSEETLTTIFDIEQAEHIMYYANLLFCIFCVIKLITIHADNSVGEFTARKMYKRIFQTELNLDGHHKLRAQSMVLLSRFKICFLCFWIMLAALYTTFTAKTFFDTGSVNSKGKLIKEDKNITSTYLIEDKCNTCPKDSISETQIHSVITYGDSVEINSPRKGDTIKLSPIKYYSYSAVLNNRWSNVLAYSFNTISIMFILWCFGIISFPSQKSSLIYLSIFITAILVAAYPLFLILANYNGIYYEESLNNYSVLFDALSGVINAVILALLIARLDSKLLSLPSNLIVVLYIYAAVQPLFAVFDLPGFVSETIKVIVLFAVFWLKILFFFIISYALQTGRFFSYLYCFPTLNKRVESIVANPFQIHIIHEEKHHFNFNIYKGDLIIFNGHIDCKSQDECIPEIEKVKVITAQRTNYYIEYVAEQWYINIRDEIKNYTAHLI